MVEPTETESREDLDRLVAALRARRSTRRETDPELLLDAPRTMPVRRLDEVGAARNPVVRQRFPEDDEAAPEAPRRPARPGRVSIVKVLPELRAARRRADGVRRPAARRRTRSCARRYTWSPPAVSLGKFQRVDERAMPQACGSTSCGGPPAAGRCCTARRSSGRSPWPSRRSAGRRRARRLDVAKPTTSSPALSPALSRRSASRLDAARESLPALGPVLRQRAAPRPAGRRREGRGRRPGAARRARARARQRARAPSAGGADAGRREAARRAVAGRRAGRRRLRAGARR